jgi:hypothetical protein
MLVLLQELGYLMTGRQFHWQFACYLLLCVKNNLCLVSSLCPPIFSSFFVVSKPDICSYQVKSSREKNSTGIRSWQLNSRLTISLLNSSCGSAENSLAFCVKFELNSLREPIVILPAVLFF